MSDEMKAQYIRLFGEETGTLAYELGEQQLAEIGPLPPGEFVFDSTCRWCSKPIYDSGIEWLDEDDDPRSLTQGAYCDKSQTGWHEQVEAREVRYPHITVVLTGTDGNAGSVMGAVTRELRRHHVTSEEINLFRMECMSGNYDQLLQTCMEWVEVE